MTALVFALAVTLGPATPTTWIDVPSVSSQNVSASIELANKRMNISICCVTRRDYSLAIGQGTCAAPVPNANAVVVGQLEWRMSNGKLVARPLTIFPIKSKLKYHLFVFDDVARPQTQAPLACADVPADLLLSS